jgi:hypothetical protein
MFRFVLQKEGEEEKKKEKEQQQQQKSRWWRFSKYRKEKNPNAVTIVVPKKVKEVSRTRPATGARSHPPAGCSGRAGCGGSKLWGPLPFLFCGFSRLCWNQREGEKETEKSHKN